MLTLEFREQQLQKRCKDITKLMAQLIEEITALENTPDDEAAYSIMSLVRRLTAQMDSARFAAADDHGNDELDGYEAVANAIRAAKELI
jgi:hypothetical protein